MKLLWWRKVKKEKIDAGGFIKEFYENQALEMARKILESPTREEADKIIEQFKLSHPGKWIKNDDARNFQTDGSYQSRALTIKDDGKYYLSSIDNGYYVCRQIMRAFYTREYGFIPCPTKDRTDLDILSYRENMDEPIRKLKLETSRVEKP